MWKYKGGTLQEERTRFMASARERIADENPSLSKTEINKLAGKEWLTCPLRMNTISKLSEKERKKHRF